MEPTYRIVLTAQARAMLAKIKDRRTLKTIGQRIDGLAREPEKQGRPLIEPLAGFRSPRAAGQRYRIIYRVDREEVIVLVVAVGPRKKRSRADIYALAGKLIRSKLLDPPSAK